MADDFLKTCDELHAQNKIQELLDLLTKEYEKDNTNIEVGWRLARAYFDVGEEKINDKEFKKQMLLKGLDIASKCIVLNDKHWATHKWFAIMTSSMGEFVSTKEKIGNAYKIKEHALKAIELHPNDATTLYLLGRWCFSVASVGWIERQVASALFATPPTSSFEEALSFFLKGYEVQKEFINNNAWIGDTYVQLKQNDKAKEFYNKVISATAEKDSEKLVVEETKKKLSKL